MRRGVYKHYITVNKLETAALAGRHLWHELTHAAQHERHYVNGDWSGFLHWYKAQQNFPYRVRPCEIEAREAEEFNDIYPLTKPAERSKIAA